MEKRTIAVVGGTGSQGGGVVEALLSSGEFAVRVGSRNPDAGAAQALKQRGVEVVKADLLEVSSLGALFSAAHGAFVVTNFWDPTQTTRETEVGVGAVKAARAAGVEHLVWSTLPNAQELSEGRLNVMHFTGKAKVDAAVEEAGFTRHTFVHAPMYFQNFLTMMGPQDLPGGGRGWAVPMDPSARVMHAGDASEVGRAVAAAFSAGDKLASGSHLAVCGGTYSWNDFVETLNAQGHNVQVQQVPAEVYDDFFEGASELREMFQYFELCTYFGPDHEQRIAAANALVPGGFTSFADWAKRNMAATRSGGR